MDRINQLALYAKTELKLSFNEGWDSICYGLPDIGFAIFFVGILMFGSIYFHWLPFLIAGGVLLKNRLEDINGIEDIYAGE